METSFLYYLDDTSEQVGQIQHESLIVNAIVFLLRLITYIEMAWNGLMYQIINSISQCNPKYRSTTSGSHWHYLHYDGMVKCAEWSFYGVVNKEGDKTPYQSNQYFIFLVSFIFGSSWENWLWLDGREEMVKQCNFQINWKKNCHSLMVFIGSKLPGWNFRLLHHVLSKFSNTLSLLTGGL